MMLLPQRHRSDTFNSCSVEGPSQTDGPTNRCNSSYARTVYLHTLQSMPCLTGPPSKPSTSLSLVLSSTTDLQPTVASHTKIAQPAAHHHHFPSRNFLAPATHLFMPKSPACKRTSVSAPARSSAYPTCTRASATPSSARSSAPPKRASS